MHLRKINIREVNYNMAVEGERASERARKDLKEREREIHVFIR
jgi:hypothetical protein